MARKQSEPRYNPDFDPASIVFDFSDYKPEPAGGSAGGARLFGKGLECRRRHS